MSNQFIQLEGHIKLGPVGGPLTDYSAEITKLVIKRTRTSVTIPATWADAEESEAAGARKNSMDIEFLTATTAASVWAELWDALDTDDAELDFEATQSTDAVGGDNPKWSGTIVVMSAETGGTAGTIRTQAQSFPIKKGTLEKATT